MPGKKDQLPIMPEGTDPAILLKAWGTGRKQKEIADQLHISLDAYKKWVGGTANIPHQRLPDIVRVFRLNEEQATQLYEAMQRMAPRKKNLPLDNRFFTGREEYIERLDQYFKEDDCVVLSGLGGIGKTQLALEYAYRRFKDKTYRAAFWVNAADQTTIESSCRELAEELDLLERDEREIKRVIHAVKRWFAEHTKWLLVMDNADDLYLARTFFPAEGQGHIILTTRSQIGGTAIACQIELAEMTQEEGLRFLLKRSRVVRNEAALHTIPADIREAAQQLVELLGRHPLALDQAGAYVEETPVSFAAYIELYQKERQFLLSRRNASGSPYGDHPESVATTIKLSISRAIVRQPIAGDILHLFMLLQPDVIPEEVFRYDHERKLFDALTFNDGITALLRYSLIRRNASEKTYSIHRLVQAAALDQFTFDWNLLTPEAKMYWQERVVWGVAYAFPRDLHNFKNWQLCDRLVPHMVSCLTWQELDDRPTAESAIVELLYKAAFYLSARGHSIDTEPMLVRALAISEHHYGTDHVATATALKNLAAFYIDHGREQEGKRMLEQALAIREKHPEDDPLAVSRILSSLSWLHEKHGDYEEAERLKLRVLAERERHLGAEHPEVAKELGLLASFYVRQGKYEQAMPLFERANKIFDQQIALGNIDEQDPYIPMSMAGVYTLLHRLGRLEEAEDYFLRLVRAKERLLGPTHPDVILSKRTSINGLHQFGRHEEAEALEREIKAAEASGETSG